MKNLRKRLACLLLSALLLIGCLYGGADRRAGVERQRTHLHRAGYRHDLSH